MPRGRKLLEKREKSIAMTSNIARPSTTNSSAIPTLNQGDELIVPNVPAVRITTSAEDAVDDRHRALRRRRPAESRGRASRPASRRR